MYTRGLRPFQSVFYVTRQIKEMVDWRGCTLSDLQQFSKVVKMLDDEEILTYLILNDSSDANILPHPLGIETIMGKWKSELESDNTEKLQDDFRRIQDKLALLDKNSALEKYLSKFNSFEIYHSEEIIFVILQEDYRSDGSNDSTGNMIPDINSVNNDGKTNLLNIATLNQLRKDIISKVVQVYSKYYTYEKVSHTPWFTSYIDQL